MEIITKEQCVNKGIHNCCVFISCFPSKKFCKHCMTTIEEDKDIDETMMVYTSTEDKEKHTRKE